MDSKKFKEGKILSKNHSKRTKEDSDKLYRIIEEAVDIACLRNGDRSEQAMNFLINIFMPHITKIAYRIHRKTKESSEFKDIKQEVQLMFITLVDKYKKEKSTFPYYIGRMLPKYMNKWTKRELKYIDSTVNLGDDEDYIVDPMFDSLESSINYLNNFILEKEYIDFIKDSSKKKSRSTTHKEVCLNFFLSNRSCKQIAEIQNISYNAVYEVIGKIKNDLQFFFSDNMFTDYIVSSTGTERMGIKGVIRSH